MSVVSELPFFSVWQGHTTIWTAAYLWQSPPYSVEAHLVSVAFIPSLCVILSAFFAP
jgi:hypothetical protein